MANELRAVFFDLGGTLFSNAMIPKVTGPVLIEASERLGCPSPLTKCGVAYLRAARRVNSEYVDRPFYLHRDLFHDIFRHFAEAFDREATPEFIDWFYEAQREPMVTQMVLRDDARETLEALRGRGLSLSIVSNIDEDFFAPMLETLALGPLFDHTTSSEEAKACKPHPGIFEVALRKAACRPEEVLFVGDSRVHDIQGAAAMGMKSALIVEGGKSTLEVDGIEAEPDHVIEELGELVDVVG